MGLDSMGLNEWLLIAGTMLGPILAVQAQKWVERARESDNRKRWVFYTLMATRGSRLGVCAAEGSKNELSKIDLSEPLRSDFFKVGKGSSTPESACFRSARPLPRRLLADDHVRALNSIDLVFYGVRLPVWGKPIRSRKSQGVLDAWREYHAHLNLPDGQRPTSNESLAQWATKGDELFLNLLVGLAGATHHEFDRQILRTGGYSPLGHGRRDEEQEAVRRGLLDVLDGKRSVPMEVTSFPMNPQFMEADAKFKASLITALEQIAKGRPS